MVCFFPYINLAMKPQVKNKQLKNTLLEDLSPNKIKTSCR